MPHTIGFLAIVPWSKVRCKTGGELKVCRIADQIRLKFLSTCLPPESVNQALPANANSTRTRKSTAFSSDQTACLNTDCSTWFMGSPNKPAKKSHHGGRELAAQLDAHLLRLAQELMKRDAAPLAW